MTRPALILLALLFLAAAYGCAPEPPPAAPSVPAPTRIPTPAPALEPTSQPVSIPSPAPTATPAAYDAQEQPRDVSAVDLFSGHAGSGYSGGPEATVEEVLEKGLLLAEASPVHLAVRGTVDGSSVRCGWRGIARTPKQREGAIRLWLGLDADDDIPDVAFLETMFTAAMDVIDPLYRETAKSNFLAMARGGLSEEYLFLTCHADYVPSEYLLGTGPNKLTMAYDRRGEAHSYELYRAEHDDDAFGDDPLMSEGEYQEHLDGMVREAEAWLASAIGGRDSVVFLAPMGAHNAIAVEAWQTVAQWDLQTAEDGTVNAVRYGASPGDPEYTQTLSNLKSRITAATAASTAARIASVSGLTQHYRDMGAYGDITPEDGSTATFTPAQPPDAYSCAGGTAVANPTADLGLVHDCEALFDGKDALRGTGSLNWDAGTAIGSWEGVTTAGTPTRVTKLELPTKSLTGAVPPGIGALFQLTHLDLSSNSLTGDIPAELGWLDNLEKLQLSGNSLTGCIPLGLKDVSDNDLSSLELPYCDTPTGLKAAAGDGSVTLTWDAPSGSTVTGYEYTQRAAPPAPGWGKWTAVPDSGPGTTSHTVTGLTNGTEYRFKLRAVTTSGASDPAPNAAPWYAAATPQPPLPAIPTGLTAVAGRGSVTLTWNAPVGSTVTGYEYTQRVAPPAPGWGKWTAVPDSGPGTTSHTVTGLTAGREYRFKLRAVNTAGVSSPAPNAAPWFVKATPGKP